MYHYLTICTAVHLTLLYKLFILGVCPLVYLNLVPNAKKAFVTSYVSVFQNENRFKYKYINIRDTFVLSVQMSFRRIYTKYTQSILWIRIQLLKLACPITIGQTIFSLLLYGFYLHILARMMLAGSIAYCVVPTIEVDAQTSLATEEAQVNWIKENIIPSLLRVVSRFSLLDPGAPDWAFRYDISTHLRFREGYHAIGYIWPNASLSQIGWSQESNPNLQTVLGMISKLHPEVISRFGSAFYSHFTDQMSTVMRQFLDLTPEEARDRHIEAMRELKNALPFYLEFQLPGVDFLLRALEYPTEISSFYDVSLIGKVESEGLVAGLYHKVPTNMNDPYCPSLDEMKEEIFTNFENRIRENLLRPLSEDNQSIPPILTRDELLNFSKCKKEFLHHEFLKVKINKIIVEHEHKYQLMAGGAMTVAIGYGIYSIAQIL